MGQLARPLVLFYGVMALSRAAILFFKPNAKEANLNPAHGLTVLSWQQTLEGGIKNIPELRLKAVSGTFIELADATQVVDRVSVYVAPYPATKLVRTANLASMNVGWALSLRDLLGRVPDLHNMYEETFQAHAPCRRVFVFLIAGPGPCQTAIDVLATRLGLPSEVQAQQDLGLDPGEQLIKRSNHNFLGAVEHWSVQQPRQSLQDVLDRLPHLVNDAAGNMFVVPTIPQGPRLSKLLLLYAISFAMGMLARYYPSRWVSLLAGGAGDFSYPLLAEASRVVEDLFPQLLAAEFWSTD